jgi:hypothetical protein
VNRRPRRAVAPTSVAANAALVAILAGTFGCSTVEFSSADVGTREADAEAATTEAELASIFSPGRAILEGFDPPADDGAWKVGDKVLFGFRLRRAEGDVVRFVRLEARTDPQASGKAAVGTDGDPAHPPSGKPAIFLPRHQNLVFTGEDGAEVKNDGEWIAVAATVYDETGARLGHHVVTLPTSSLREGVAPPALRARDFFKAARAEAEAASRAAETRSSGEADSRNAAQAVARVEGARRDFMFLITSIFGFLDVLRQHPDLEGLREIAAAEVVQKPSFLSVVASFGVKMNVEPQIEAVAADRRPLGTGFETSLVPVRFSLNKTPAFSLVFSAGAPTPPYHVGVGLSAIDGYRPGDDAPRLQCRLLAARR